MKIAPAVVICFTVVSGFLTITSQCSGAIWFTSSMPSASDLTWMSQPLFWSGAEAFSEGEKQRLISPRLRRSLKGLTSWNAIAPIHERFRARAWDQSPLSWMSYVDLHLRLPELLLMRVDKMTMGVGLEGRVPFLDHRLVALAMSIPSSRKASGGRLKHLLKTAVRGLVPDALIDRRKQGFGVPVDELFDGRLTGTATAFEVRNKNIVNDLSQLDPATGMQTFTRVQSGEQRCSGVSRIVPYCSTESKESQYHLQQN